MRTMSPKDFSGGPPNQCQPDPMPLHFGGQEISGALRQGLAVNESASSFTTMLSIMSVCPLTYFS